MEADEVKTRVRGLHTIVTHRKPDLDACMSAFLLWRAAGRPEGVNYVFVPHRAGGDSRLLDGWFVVDTGGGMFDHHQDSAPWTSATEAVYNWLAPTYGADERWALKVFVEMANTQDTGRSRILYSTDPFRRSVAEAFSVSALVQALTYHGGKSDEENLKTVLSVLDLLFERKLGHAEVRRRVDEKETWVSDDGRVCVLKDSDVRYTKMVEKKGRQVVVYTSGRSLGIVTTRHGRARGVDLTRFYSSSEFRSLFGDTREWVEWTKNKDGFMLARSTRGRHSNRGPSVVKPESLAKAVFQWLSSLE